MVSENVLMYCQKDGAKRSQRRVIERRKESERLQTKGGEYKREERSWQRKRRERRCAPDSQGNDGVCKPVLKLQLLLSLAVGP